MKKFKFEWVQTGHISGELIAFIKAPSLTDALKSWSADFGIFSVPELKVTEIKTDKK